MNIISTSSSSTLIITISSILSITSILLFWKKKQHSRQRSLCINSYQPFVCGCIGGLGPKATASFYDENILKARHLLHLALQSGNIEQVRKISTAPWTQEQIQRVWELRQDVGTQLRDQDHISLLIYSNPVIPGRPEFMSGASNVDPTDALVHTARSLVNAGASALCMLCSTAHHFKDAMMKQLPKNTDFWDIMEMTLQHIIDEFGDGEYSLGLLGTEPLLHARLYEKALQRIPNGKKIRIVSPVSLVNGNQKNVNNAIFGHKGIKAGFDGDLDDPACFQNFALLLEEVLKIQQQKPKMIILGCTELPIVLTPENLKKFGPRVTKKLDFPLEDLDDIRFINPMQILGDKIIHLSLISRFESV